MSRNVTSFQVLDCKLVVLSSSRAVVSFLLTPLFSPSFPNNLRPVHGILNKVNGCKLVGVRIVAWRSLPSLAVVDSLALT